MDSILWVLGEQSTKTLRSEKMEDVIFNGTELHKPLGLVEVSLVISGLGELRLDAISGLPSELSEYQELMITRRLYRNGDSEYLINKTPCRLKDIRNVLIETRAGSRGMPVIEQGRIEQILQASPPGPAGADRRNSRISTIQKQKPKRSVSWNRRNRIFASARYCGGSEEAAELVGASGSPGSDLSDVTAGSQGLEIETAVP